MKMRLLIAMMLIGLWACNDKPKVIVEDVTTASPAEGQQGMAQGVTVPGQQAAATSDVHQVTALELLQAERHTYLRVTENADTFWIAASKMEAAKGRKYFYRGGLLKTDFESAEFNRVFDKIYLVSQIIDASAHPGGSGGAPTAEVDPKEIKNIPGKIALSELLGNSGKYDGKAIVVAGKVVKVNNGIMGRNWVHIQDGTSLKSKKCDLTITTMENIPIGSTLAFEGKVALNKDFGAGYRYDIIVEEAVVK
ncbi:MAG: hypothetical protein IPN29_17600 [Saprospiraceae bacterium]|nr:hypothetical protein [Saprospiraceae bacterium]